MKPMEKPKRNVDVSKTTTDGLYRPVILKYKCLGGIHFQQPSNSSKSKTKQPINDLAATAPTCHGIETELERMYEFEPMPARKAVFNFAQYTSTTVAGSAEAWESRRHRMEKGFGGDIFNSNKRNVQEGYSSHDLDKEEMQKLFPFVIDHRAIDYDSGHEENDNHISSNTLDRLREAARHNIEILNDGKNTSSPKKHESTLWNTASFYGNTDITILVLFPYLDPYRKEGIRKSEETNQKSDERIEPSATLAALAPELKLGLAVRKAGDKKYPGIVDELSTARIGPVEISIGSRIEETEEDLEDTDESGSYETHHHNDKLSQHQKDTGRRKGITLEDVTQSMTDAAQKTASRMVTNFNLIRNELSDDFIGRTMSSGERVVDSCGKSVERMHKLISDIYDDWMNSNNSKKR